jgi:hypothetical protein
MNKSGPVTFRPLHRLIAWGAFSVLPATFAANGPPPVTVTQPVTVQVVNNETAPVQTQDVDNPAFQPVIRSAILVFNPGQFSNTSIITVPNGKRLVIEFVSFQTLLQGGQEPTEHQIRISNPGQLIYTFQFVATRMINSFVTGAPTRLYANPGAQVLLEAGRNASTGNGTSTVTISGYYVNVP